MLKNKKRRPHRRRDFVVQKILACARAELGAAGAAGFRVERVAKAAEVNKTTIYRRWPKKELLIRAATVGTESGARAGEVRAGAGAGARALRAELVAAALAYLAWIRTDVGRALSALPARGGDPELRKVARSLREEHRTAVRARLAEARARGELRGKGSEELFLDAWFGALHLRERERGRVDARDCAGLVEFLLGRA